MTKKPWQKTAEILFTTAWIFCGFAILPSAIAFGEGEEPSPLVGVAVDSNADTQTMPTGGAVVRTAQVKEDPNKMQQNHAFQSASEINSWMALYMKDYGTLSDGHETALADGTTIRGKEKRDFIRAALKECLGNPNIAACPPEKQKAIVQGILQYNMGREVRKNILEMNTAAENMKSLNNGLMERSKGNNREAFTLHESDVKLESTISGKSAKETEQLGMMGDEFLSNYKSFINYYSNNKDKREWHYIASKKPTSNGRTVIETELNSPGVKSVDEPRYLADQRSQALVQPHVKAFVDGLQKPIILGTEKKGNQTETKIDAAGLDFAESGLNGGSDRFTDSKTGKPITKEPDPLAPAKAIVRDINSRVTEAVLKERQKKANIGKNLVIGTQISIPEFDKFLDEIWPRNPERAPSSTPLSEPKQAAPDRPENENG